MSLAAESEQSENRKYPIIFSKDRTPHLPYSPYSVRCPMCAAAKDHRCIKSTESRLERPHIDRFLMAAAIYREAFRKKLASRNP
jgi:hypothetical protein